MRTMTRGLVIWTMCSLLALLTGCGPAPSGRNHVRIAPANEGLQGLLNAFPQDTGPGGDLRSAPAQSPSVDRTSFDQLYEPTSPSIPPGTNTLVLYDDDGPFGYLGELYAIAAGHLASHFGTWVAKPVLQYASGDVNRVNAVIYIGSTYRDPSATVPPTFVAFDSDVLATTRPVIWIFDNIWLLANSSPTFTSTYGFNPWIFSAPSFDKVRYKGRTLTRYAGSGATGVMQYSPLDTTRATVLATATSVDGQTTIPWALRARNLIYVGENPFAYIKESDRYLIFSDLLFEALAPATAERHRALVRIEDVSPAEDPAKLKEIADVFSQLQVPFSVALVPRYEDPAGYYNCVPNPPMACTPTPESYGMSDVPEFVDAIQYMVARGGTLILHGFKHQFSDASNPYLIQTPPFPPPPVGNCSGRTADGKQVCNPYSGVTADDFEFWMSHINAANSVILDGPVPGDSANYASGRIQGAFAELGLAGMAAAQLFGFEFPHYAGSGIDSRTIAQQFAALGSTPKAYHRSLYFKGAITGSPDDPTRYIGQFFPYTATDVYGWRMIPENVGNYEPEPVNNNPPRLVPDLIANANANLVVRDGVASVFFHPYYPTQVLRDIIQGFQGAGYTFVSPRDL